jgi:RNA polymerase sigma-70 factor (ECF subfamily)
MRLTDDHDRHLAERAAAGDDQAFAALVARHRGALVGFVARRSGRATIAEDAVQEAMLSAHRALRQGSPPRDVKAWLHAIAWRRAVDMLRREPAAVGEWRDVRAVDGADVVAADACEFDRMMQHWRRLPHRQRHALAMRVLEGRSLEEIGHAFGVSPDAAKSLVARSRRSLAVAVADPEPAISRPRRSLLLFPPSLLERMRDAAVFASHNEQPVSFVSKACAGVCAAALAGGGSAAVVAVAPMQPIVRAPGHGGADARPRTPEVKLKKARPAPPVLKAPARRPTTPAPRPTTAPAPVRPAATVAPPVAVAGGSTPSSPVHSVRARRVHKPPPPLPAG